MNIHSLNTKLKLYTSPCTLGDGLYVWENYSLLVHIMRIDWWLIKKTNDWLEKWRSEKKSNSTKPNIQKFRSNIWKKNQCSKLQSEKLNEQADKLILPLSTSITYRCGLKINLAYFYLFTRSGHKSRAISTILFILYKLCLVLVWTRFTKVSYLKVFFFFFLKRSLILKLI